MKCHGLQALCACLILFCLSPIAAELPVESFSQLPSFQRPKLSPDGTQVAYINNVDAKGGMSVLMVYDLNKQKQNILQATDNLEVKISWFEWANNKTLLVGLAYAARRHRVDTKETRMVALEADGSDKTPRLLIKPRSSFREHVSQFQDDVLDFLPDDPDHILISMDLDMASMPSVYKVNIYTREKSRIEHGKQDIRAWMTDQQHQLRLGVAVDYKSGETEIKIRKNEDDDWQDLFKYNAMTDPAISPLGFALDPNILYYTAYKDDKKALYKINLTSHESELVFSDPNYDMDGRLIYSGKTHDVIGFTHTNTDTGRVYWDEDKINFINAINKALPDMDNYVVDYSRDENIYLLYTENDHTPGIYLLGNRKQKKMDVLFNQYPNITEDTLGSHKLVAYTARDGAKIEGYLSLPKNAEGPYPLIMHPHGGPGARELGGFDYWTSFFTSRGYAVFRPNFRGSTGYGYEFSQSQMKGWGLTMQDDITDATHWLIEQKIADPERMCIVGASYGGYAAAMAAVKTPDLFKCAVSLAGVFNLKRLVIKSRRYTNSEFVKNQIGDDFDDLEARSPYYQIDKIKTPMLIMHGEDDRVVDVDQSRDMAEELNDEDKKVEFIELPKGDHYLSVQANRHQAFRAMDKFLKTYLTK